jgi:hypothetical protein
MPSLSLLIEASSMEPTAATLQLPAGCSVTEVTEALESLLGAEPDIHRLNLVMGGVFVGTTSRSFLERSLGGRIRGTTDSDRGSLFSESRQFRLIKYLCVQPGCTEQPYFGIHYDEETPECIVEGHGKMAQQS